MFQAAWEFADKFADKIQFAVEILWRGRYNGVNKDKSNFIQKYTIPLAFGASNLENQKEW